MNFKILFLLLLVNFSLAQNKYDFNQFTDEGGDFFAAPLKWQTEDFLILGLTIGATFGSMQFDEDMKEFTQTGKSESSSIPILLGRFYGEPITPALLSSYFIINGNSTGNKYQKKLGFEIAQATFFATVTTQILKTLVGRERPALTDNNKSFTGFNLFDNDYFSLPSGHTTIAFALSTVLSRNTDSDILKVLSFAPALLTAYSRIYENRHWLSDVVIGGIIGYTSAAFFVTKHKKNDTAFEVNPTQIFSVTIPIN